MSYINNNIRMKQVLSLYVVTNYFIYCYKLYQLCLKEEEEKHQALVTKQKTLIINIVKNPLEKFSLLLF